MKRPAFQFYPADWRKDVALQSCSLAARGLWHEVMCLMHECVPYGHLAVNGAPMKPAQVARLVGVGEAEYLALMAEIDAAGVSSATEDGTIFSRRMVRDEHIRKVRADAGKRGGNPKLRGDSGEQESGQNGEEGQAAEQAPAKEKPKAARANAVVLQTFLDDCKAKNEKPLRDYKPLWDYTISVGLDEEMVALAWAEFRRRFTAGGPQPSKRQKDWRCTFRKYVENNYFKLWAIDADGQYFLTSAGKQAQKFQEAKAA